MKKYYGENSKKFKINLKIVIKICPDIKWLKIIRNLIIESKKKKKQKAKNKMNLVKILKNKFNLPFFLLFKN